MPVQVRLIKRINLINIAGIVGELKGHYTTGVGPLCLITRSPLVVKPAPRSTPTYDDLSRKEIATGLRRNLPSELVQLPIFVVFKFATARKLGGKRSKLPYYVVSKRLRSGEHGTPSDRSNLVNFGQALRLFEKDDTWSGIGACALEDNNLIFVDLDNCFDPKTGTLTEVANELLSWNTYAELSPSGRGLRLIFKGRWSSTNIKNHVVGIEIFGNKGFVTITGMVFGGKKPLRTMSSSQVMRLRELMGAASEAPPVKDTPEQPVNIPAPLTKDRFRDLRAALKYIDPDCTYADWIKVGQAIHSSSPHINGKGFPLWVGWSRRGDKFEGTSVEDMMRKWKGFKPGRGITLSTIFGMAREGGYTVKDRTLLREKTAEKLSTAGLKVLYAKDIVARPKHPIAKGLFDDHGAYLFIGRAKIGKSRILGAFVAGALSGGSVMGFKFEKKCRVLALTLEEDPDALLDRVRLYAVDPADHHRRLRISTEIEVEQAAEELRESFDWAAWVDLLLKEYRPDFVYLDTAVKLRMLWQNDPEGNRHRTITEQDYQNINWLDKAARKHGCVLVVTMHGSKRKPNMQGDFDPFDSIGTTSWSLAGCTGAIVLMDKPGRNVLEESSEQSPHRLLCLRGRYMAHGDKHYLLEDRDNGTFANLGEYHVVQASLRTSQFLAFIAESQREGAEAVTARIIAAECGCSVPTVRLNLRKFIETEQLYEGQRLEGVQNVGYRLVAARRQSHQQ